MIVTDRGSLKAYRVNQTPTRGPSLQLVQAFNITDAHGRLVDKVSDFAGRFAVSDGAGAHHGAASADRTQQHQGAGIQQRGLQGHAGDTGA